MLTTRIKYLTEHMKENRKDLLTKRNLERLINGRRTLMEYLKRTAYPRYKATIDILGLDDTVKGWPKRKIVRY